MSHDDRRHQEDEVREILRRRQKNINHFAYGLVAASLASTALMVWGFILSDALRDGGAPLTKGYASFLAFAMVLGIAASGAIVTWMIVRDGRRRAAEEDVIREFDQHQQLGAIHDAIAVFLREGDEAALRVLTQTRSLLDGHTDSEAGSVRQFRGRR